MPVLGVDYTGSSGNHPSWSSSALRDEEFKAAHLFPEEEKSNEIWGRLPDYCNISEYNTAFDNLMSLFLNFSDCEKLLDEVFQKNRDNQEPSLRDQLHQFEERIDHRNNNIFNFIQEFKAKNPLTHQEIQAFDEGFCKHSRYSSLIDLVATFFDLSSKAIGSAVKKREEYKKAQLSENSIDAIVDKPLKASADQDAQESERLAKTILQFSKELFQRYPGTKIFEADDQIQGG